MEDKRKDLKGVQQRKIIDGILAELSKTDPSLYYSPTIELAAEIKNHIHTPGKLKHEDLQLVSMLGRRDIQIMLGVHQ